MTVEDVLDTGDESIVVRDCGGEDGEVTGVVHHKSTTLEPIEGSKTNSQMSSHCKEDASDGCSLIIEQTSFLTFVKGVTVTDLAPPPVDCVVVSKQDSPSRTI